MIGMIAAVTSNGVIGVSNNLPFNYPEDLAHFKKTTLNSVVIMGRKTFESIKRPLPDRVNIVVSNSLNTNSNIERASSLDGAISKAINYNKNIWLIGGSSIYTDGMKFVDKIVLTITPDIINDHNSIKFPWINPLLFSENNKEILSAEKKLHIITYNKIL